MNQRLSKQATSFFPGSVIRGHWHKQPYTVVSLLGKGAIGSVYLCKRSDGKKVALKISEKSASITTEVNVLKQLSKVQGKLLGPSLFDVDDFLPSSGMRLSFYVMEYVEGKPVPEFLKKRGKDWFGVFLLQLLSDLERLHQHGWVFGDLKLDNILVTDTPPRIRWIDVGGTTQIGRSIKEYTEFYDRGYWQLGTRRAEPSYDLFAVVMLALHYAYPKQFERGTNPEQTLRNKIKQAHVLQPYQVCLERAMKGYYRSSSQMLNELNQLLTKKRVPTQRTQAITKNKLTHTETTFPLIETSAIGFVSTLFFIIYHFFM
ncbi:Serine/threonine-protein kinase PknG [Paraliobacillus sp. PM-2]|uniref:protein kinase domain-containing protein n=1 Tax=Paraliobacillus sp. PM-2 TaxID=1462524 RepID=UPI00061C194D|nr:protein kinase [Paraliobacillus sp. PM-2]CQR47456.1 Serine/threonine-protein kinase PknG [Paraliobacillus sp. PM-2]